MKLLLNPEVSKCKINRHKLQAPVVGIVILVAVADCRVVYDFCDL